jgi:hypothetical protein
LKGLRAVRWSGLAGAYGPASAVPAYLSTIAWGDRPSALAALDDLQLQIFPGRTAVYEVTPEVIPFLWQLVVMPEVRIRAEILELLREIRRSHAWASAAASGGVAPYAEQVGWEARARASVERGVAGARILGESIDPDVARAYRNLADEAGRPS